MKSELIARLEELKTIIEQLGNDKTILDGVEEIVHDLVLTLKRGNRVWFCGNGGSAADAQHLAAELSGKFYLDRNPLSVEALHVNSSFLTAVANDYGYEYTFSRAIEGQGKEGDALVALSTSGRSINILKALERAHDLSISTILITGNRSDHSNMDVNHVIVMPSENTPRIQEMTMVIGHYICEMVEKRMNEGP